MKRLVLPEEDAFTAGGFLLPPVSALRADAEFLRRFWTKVNQPSGKRRHGSCWLWHCYKNSKGYGRMCLTHNGRSTKVFAHRISHALHSGAWSVPSLMLCHECDNPACVNPHHLHPGTAADNNEECRMKGRWRNGRDGKRIYIPNGVDNWTRGVDQILRGGSALTPDDVKRIRREADGEGGTLLLAFDYDCTEQTINAIARRERFAWVYGEAA